MAYTIINESNYREILDKLIKLVDHKVYVYEYGIYDKSTMEDVLAGKCTLEIKQPCFWVQNNGETFRDRLCSLVMTNASYLDVEEHWSRREYLEGGKEHSFIDWERHRTYISIHASYDDCIVLYENDAIEFTENGFKVLVDENEVSDFVRYCDFKCVMDINDYEYEGLRASKEAYAAEMEEIEARLDDMHAQDDYEDLCVDGPCLSEPDDIDYSRMSELEIDVETY